MAYTEVTVTGYNATPPPDDGSTGTDNQVTWAGIKTKLGDPLKTAIEAVDDNVAAWGATVDSSIATNASNIATNTSDIASNAADIASNLATAQSSLYAPSGTFMLFRQTTPPTGWTKQTTYNDTGLRVVSGSVSQYTSGYAYSSFHTASAWSSASSSPGYTSHTHYYADSTSTNGNHNHTFSNNVSGNANVAAGSGETPESNNSYTDTTSTTGNHNHSLSGSTNASGSGSSHSHSIDVRVDYVDVIMASKS